MKSIYAWSVMVRPFFFFFEKGKTHLKSSKSGGNKMDMTQQQAINFQI